MLVRAACDARDFPKLLRNRPCRGAGIIYRSGTLDDEGHIRLEDLRDTESMAAVRSMLLDGEALRLSGSLGSMVVTGAARGGNLRGGNLRCHQAGRRALVW